MQITEKQANRIYERRFKVSRLRQLWFGGRTASNNHFLRPCPRCHGNDRIVELCEAPGFVWCKCERCNVEYLG